MCTNIVTFIPTVCCRAAPPSLHSTASIAEVEIRWVDLRLASSVALARDRTIAHVPRPSTGESRVCAPFHSRTVVARREALCFGRVPL